MKKIQEQLEKGRTISQYPTGNVYGYGEYYRWENIVNKLIGYSYLFFIA